MVHLAKVIGWSAILAVASMAFVFVCYAMIPSFSKPDMKPFPYLTFGGSVFVIGFVLFSITFRRS